MSLELRLEPPALGWMGIDITADGETEQDSFSHSADLHRCSEAAKGIDASGTARKPRHAQRWSFRDPDGRG